MYENNNGENVVFNKDPQSLRLATMSSSVVPGADLKRLIANHRVQAFWLFGFEKFLGGGHELARLARRRENLWGKGPGHASSENFGK